MTILERIRSLLRITSPRLIYIYSVVIGILAGFGAAGVAYAVAWAEHMLLVQWAGLPLEHAPGAVHVTTGERPPAFTPWIFALLPAAGGLIVGLMARYFGRAATGSGTDDMIEAFHQREGVIRPGGPLTKTAATIVTLGSGGSGGPEGPISYIGAGLGSWIGQLIRAGARARRTLLIAGAAGGLGALFRAPLGGAMVAVEVLYKEDIESDSLVPAILSSVTAYLTYTAIHGPGSLFRVREIAMKDYRELLIYAALGLVCYAAGYVYVRFYHLVRIGFQRAPLPIWIKPAIGGAIVGAVAFFFPQAAGEGLGYLQRVLNGAPVVGLSRAPLTLALAFLLIAALKIVTSSFTVGSGGAAGLFAPSLFVGAMLGGFVGALAQYLLPAWRLPIAPFMLVGMSALFAGVARAPFASMIMVCDVIGSYKLLPQLMIVSMISFVLSHRWSLYTQQMENRFKSPAHHWDMQLDVLDQLRLKDEFPEFRQIAIVDRSASLSSAEELAVQYQATDFVVRDGDRYLGMLSFKKTRMSANDLQQLRGLISVEDITDVNCPAVRPEDSLSNALAIITRFELDKVAVADTEGRLLGYVRYNEIFAAYQKRQRARAPSASASASASG